MDRLLLLRLWLGLIEVGAEEKRWLEPTVLSEMKMVESRSISAAEVRDRLVQISRNLQTLDRCWISATMEVETRLCWKTVRISCMHFKTFYSGINFD